VFGGKQQNMFLVRHLQNPADNLDIFKYVCITYLFSHSMGSLGNKLHDNFERTSATHLFFAPLKIHT